MIDANHFFDILQSFLCTKKENIERNNKANFTTITVNTTDIYSFMYRLGKAINCTLQLYSFEEGLDIEKKVADLKIEHFKERATIQWTFGEDA